jgi:sporulation protein YlmC with PRC-barrel domain
MFNKKEIKAISKDAKNPSSMDSMRKYLGRKVRSKSGENLGGIYDILFSGNKIEGFIVVKRLSAIYIAKEFFSSFSKKSAMLSIDPVTLMIRKHVFDSDGKNLGRVSKIQRKSHANDFEAIIVKKNFFSRGLIVPKSDIDVAKKNIILKVVYE